MVQETDPRVDELRRQLRSLGYLDAGVDRFLLAPAQEARGPVAVAARAAVRVGLLAGVLLGPCATVGLGARVPGLVSGPRDAAVLAVYLAALFFLAFTVLALAASLGAVLIARTTRLRFASRARLISSGAGWIVTVACLFYLTLWWRAANAGFGWTAPLWTIFALTIAVTVSLVLGHAVRITTLAVLAVAAGPTQPLPPVSPRSWRYVFAGGVLAFAGAAALLIWSAPADLDASSARPAMTVVSTGKRVRLVAIDGFDNDVYRTAVARGRISESTVGIFATLSPQDTSDPAAAWTTIATGTAPDVHGVHGLETRRVAGVQGIIAARTEGIGRILRAGTDFIRLTRPSIASRDERRAKTLWEVASDAGLRTAVVNWWATWPAPASGGVVITDRALLRLERGGPLDAEIAPRALYDALRAGWAPLRQTAHDEAKRRFDAMRDPEAASILRRSAELDLTILGLLRAIPGPPRDLDVVYLPGLDIAQHALFGTPEGSRLPASAVANRVEALASYYRFLDDALAPALTAGDREAVIVVTQPGRVQTAAGGLLTISDKTMAADRTPGSTLRADVLDVLPTVMAALGVPVSRELSGKPRVVWDGRTVPSYGRPGTAAAPRGGQPLDQEMIDRLRSLGYVK
jgi:hypothetical protein